MSGFQDFIEKFHAGTYVTSKEISARWNLSKALSSLYIIPTFFRGVYYIPTEREHSGQFIEKPADFFLNLFNFVYGKKGWYWTLSTAARKYGYEWSVTKIVEIVTLKRGKSLNIAKRIAALRKKRSYRSKVLYKFLSSLGINTVLIHQGKKNFFKELQIDEEIGPIANKERLTKDLKFFLPKTKIATYRELYRKIITETKKN